MCSRFPVRGLRRQIASSGNFPVWRSDGREILYYDQGKIWSVRVEGTGEQLRFSAPEPLFSGGADARNQCRLPPTRREP